MLKILTLLTTFLATSAPIASVISCGTPSPSKIAGRENISTEFTLTNNVIVTDDNMTVEESIFNQTKIEGRLSQDLLLDFFEITDSENMIKPVTDNTLQTGYVVLTIRHDEDIPYIGSITVRFTLVKKLSMDISQIINLENIWDVTKYENADELYNDIWEKAVGSFKPETPIDAENYDILGFQLPGDYNKALPVTMFAEYNGKANTLKSIFGGTITIKLSIIIYRAMVNLKLQQNNLEPAKLYDLVWKEVKQQFNDDSQVSSDYNDYQIDWRTVTEPNIGGNTELNFLATPIDESIHHYMRVVGFIVKDQIELPPKIELSIPIVVNQQERPNVHKDWIWKLVMREANIDGGPALTNFDTTSWQSIFNKNWPNIGRREKFTLQALNLNTDPIFKGNIEITLTLINQGIDPGLLALEPILLVEDDKHTTNSVLDLVWDKLINNKAWNPHLSRDLVNFEPHQDLYRLSNALKDTKKSGKWETYVINISGKQEVAGRDFKVIVHGQIKMVNKPIEENPVVDLSYKTYQFVPRKQSSSDNQAPYLAHQIWGDIIKNSIFIDEVEPTFELSKIQTDWNYFESICQQLDEAINKYDVSISDNKIPLELQFSSKNNAIFTGWVTLKLNLTPTVPIKFNLDLTSSMLPIFIRSLPRTLSDKKELVKNMVNAILYDGIIKNPSLKGQQPNILWELLSYDTESEEFIEQFNFPTENNPQQELIIKVKTSTGQFVNGKFMLKINLIYQP